MSSGETLSATKMPTAGSRGCWTAWCQVVLFAASAFVILAERTALIYCCVYYLWNGQTLWAALTLSLALPGTAVQVLSFLWYRADGHRRTCFLSTVHLMHLGIFKRFGDCMSSVWHMQRSMGGLGAAVMQQADVSALRLLEALVLTLPQTLLQTYILITSDVGLLSPVALCCGLCLLSLSWALVLYSRACCLIRPGHLAMPPAALLCQLLWRTGMLGTRIACLMLFTRIFHWWVFGVIGFHWLTASFWLVSQQADICISPWRWRLFNCMLGAVHVFFFLNVKDSPSRFRMAGFYVVMLLENATLLLSATDFLSEASWESMSIPTAVLCSFLLGTTSLVLYYRFLHPKSTEICQSLRHNDVSGVCIDRDESSYAMSDKTVPIPSVQTHGSFSLTGLAGSLVEHSGSCGAKPSGGQCKHHHWLLIRLALKTGDMARINLAYGAGGVSSMLDMEECNPDMKDRGVSSPDSEHKAGSEPLSNCKEDFHSMSEPASFDATQDEDGSLEMVSPLESPVSEVKRGSPEGKSVLGESPERNFCPTESCSTLYFSADPQSPSSASNPGLDKDPVTENLAALSPISGDSGKFCDVRGLLNRVEPRFTSTPKLDSGVQEITGLCLAGPRRQLRKSDDGRF
ncbi:XK-related protein 5a [Scleropages formosus]|uniref:XK-related protein n=1 Tax=Scleropages formosus TaxID=113540 RepID=A0A8C9QP66_SCLFO|nr:XK-related protein 5-like [Scleropages formosus]